jgi:hypothetical protein
VARAHDDRFHGDLLVVGAHPLWEAFLESGSSLLTLGFRAPTDTVGAILTFSESIFGLGLLALVVSYLPSTYASFSRRELMVTSLDTQAGSPPSAAELLERLARIDGIGELDAFWQEWARWFADIAETHTSTPTLVLFRSPQPERSWVIAAGTVLDAAALVTSPAAVPHLTQPDMQDVARSQAPCRPVRPPRNDHVSTQAVPIVSARASGTWTASTPRSPR